MEEGALVLRLFVASGLAVALGGAAASVVLVAARPGGRRLFRPAGPFSQPSDGFVVVAAFFGVLVAQYAAQALFTPLWGPVVVYPVLIGAILGLVAALGGQNPFAGPGWAMNIVAGYLTWLLVTPAVFIVFVLATEGNRWLIDRPPDKHPLVHAIEEAGPWGWPLFFVQTLLLAPVVEELVFRGLLLPWLAQKRPRTPETALTLPPAIRPTLVLVLSVGVALLLHSKDLDNALSAGDRRGVMTHLVPAAFFAALIPLDWILPRLTRLRRRLRIRSAQHVRAIWASSALFAAVHANVWPSPVPLVVLAVGLGYLYVRTRTLVGPVVVHGLFNAVSAVYLLLGGPA